MKKIIILIKLILILNYSFALEVFNRKNSFLAPLSGTTDEGNIQSTKKKFANLQIMDQMDKIAKQINADYNNLNTANYSFLNDSHIENIMSFKPECLNLHEIMTRKVFKGEKDPSKFMNFPNKPDKKDLNGKKELNFGIYFGAFSFLHIGHILVGMNHLIHPDSKSDFVLYAPSRDSDSVRAPTKPQKLPYNIREEWGKYQLDTFFPYLRISDIARNWSPSHALRLILSNYRGFKINCTQLIGSDPIFLKEGLSEIISKDVKNYKELAEYYNVDFNFKLHILERQGYELSQEDVKKMGFNNDYEVLITKITDKVNKNRPSSTSFQVGDEKPLIYPSKKLINQFKPIFVLDRYGVHGLLRPMIKFWSKSKHLSNKDYMQKIAEVNELLEKFESLGELDSIINLFKLMGNNINEEYNFLELVKLITKLNEKVDYRNIFSVLELLIKSPELAQNILSNNTSQSA